MGGLGDPAYQDGGDNQRGVEETVRDVGGIEAAVHAEALCHMPLADLRRPTETEGWEEMDQRGSWVGCGFQGWKEPKGPIACSGLGLLVGPRKREICRVWSRGAGRGGICVSKRCKE